MRYNVQDLEDQIIATLKADTTNFQGVLVDTYAGQINAQMFVKTELMQGFIRLLPFALVSYQGRTSGAKDTSSIHDLYIHTLRFRIFCGTQSTRSTKEAARGAYQLLGAVYDDIHGHVPLSNPQKIPGITSILSGPVITTTGFNPQSPLMEAGGTDEGLIINIPKIVVYQTDFIIRLLA
jgi:Domain of unknown function (DUF1834)